MTILYYALIQIIVLPAFGEPYIEAVPVSAYETMEECRAGIKEYSQRDGYTNLMCVAVELPEMPQLPAIY